MKFVFKSALTMIVFFFIILSSCFGYQSPYYIKLADKITAKTAKKLEEQKHLYLIGTGGQMMDDIQMMAMSFAYYQEVSIETARELIVYAISNYLSAINTNAEIKPYLHEYPFTAKNVEISIFIYNPDRSKLPQEKIYCIECMKGKIGYYTRANPHQAICEENYEKALQVIGHKGK